jgi:hypothetical protein
LPQANLGRRLAGPSHLTTRLTRPFLADFFASSAIHCELGLLIENTKDGDSMIIGAGIAALLILSLFLEMLSYPPKQGKKHDPKSPVVKELDG